MRPASRPQLDHATRARLLEAAAGVFAEQGFRAATVRAICRRAGANVAAVNYHFGGKEGLYGEMLSQLGLAAVDRYPPDLGAAPGASAEERLFAFVHSFLLRTLSDDGIARHGALVAREMADPTGALDRLVDEVVRPLFGHLRGIVGELLGPRATPDEIVLCARSVVGQCLFYYHARAVIVRLTPNEKPTAARIRRIAEHVTSLSLHGMSRGPAAQSRGARARKPRR